MMSAITLKEIFAFQSRINVLFPAGWITLEIIDGKVSVEASWMEKGALAYTHSKPCDVKVIGNDTAEHKFITAFIAKVNEIIEINKGTPV